MKIKEHEQELADLAEYFKKAVFPAKRFQLNKYIWVNNDPRKLMIPKIMANIVAYKGSDAVRDSLFKHLRELKALSEELIAKS